MGQISKIWISLLFISSVGFGATGPKGPHSTKACNELLQDQSEQLPRIAPIVLKPLKKLFDDPDYQFEMKYDGFRGIGYFERGGDCRFISRNGNRFYQFQALCESISKELKVKSAIFDGEVISPDETGRPIFKQMLRRKGPFQYVAFDLLWLNGKDLRSLPLKARRQQLLKVLPKSSSHIAESLVQVGSGLKFYDLMVEYDLEGVVVKRLTDPYAHFTKWYKFKNRNYSQGFGRRFF